MDLLPYERRHLDGIIDLCANEGWPSVPADPERADRVMTAPGVTTVVAVEDERVVGFALLQSDGEIQAHLSIIVVAEDRRRAGIGRDLLQAGIERAGGCRLDLITREAGSFYEAFEHKRWSGYRLYPPFV